MNQIEFPQGVHDAVCPLDCADTCSLSIEVVDGRVEKVRGSHANPFTRGKICAKVATGLSHQVHGPDRLTTPLLRNGPKAPTPIARQVGMRRWIPSTSGSLESFQNMAPRPLRL